MTIVQLSNFLELLPISSKGLYRGCRRAICREFRIAQKAFKIAAYRKIKVFETVPSLKWPLFRSHSGRTASELCEEISLFVSEARINAPVYICSFRIS